MKLITDEGQEIVVSDLKSIIIEGDQKVVIWMPTMSTCDLHVQRIIESFDKFFGEGKWLLTTAKLSLEVTDLTDVLSRLPGTPCKTERG